MRGEKQNVEYLKKCLAFIVTVIDCVVLLRLYEFKNFE